MMNSRHRGRTVFSPTIHLNACVVEVRVPPGIAALPVSIRTNGATAIRSRRRGAWPRWRPRWQRPRWRPGGPLLVLLINVYDFWIPIFHYHYLLWSSLGLLLLLFPLNDQHSLLFHLLLLLHDFRLLGFVTRNEVHRSMSCGEHVLAGDLTATALQTQLSSGRCSFDHTSLICYSSPPPDHHIRVVVVPDAATSGLLVAIVFPAGGKENHRHRQEARHHDRRPFPPSRSVALLHGSVGRCFQFIEKRGRQLHNIVRPQLRLVGWCCCCRVVVPF